MPPAISFIADRIGATGTFAGRDRSRLASIAALHVCALAILVLTEDDVVARLAFLLTWGILNFSWLCLTRRPLISAALSLAFLAILILVSRLKYDIIWMTANFLDVMIIDRDTISFLLGIMPGLYRNVLVSLALALPVMVLLWRFDSFRVRASSALLGLSACVVGLVGLSLAEPQEDWETFLGGGYVSKFARSAVTELSELMWHGYLDSDAAVTDRLRLLPEAACVPAGKPPHILLVHDESSFDIRVAPGIKVPPGYGSHFVSFDGKARHFVVEGAGGPSWYTEYNVLAGLSARSFGKFSYYVTRIAAGRVERGLPTALRRCGYHTLSIYPALGAFMSARSFQASTGVQKFYDQKALGSSGVERDQFYYDAARHMIERERGDGPLFMFVYLAQNHYPWDYRWRPDLLPKWKDLGNPPPVDEYLRRQALSESDYNDFTDRLRRDFPDDSFLLVRYGDHQPDFASFILEPSLDESAIAQRLASFDPRYFTTYYAIDPINYKPVKMSSAIDTIEGPYLPLVIQDLAGVPLDASFAEQKKIFQRCNGTFYACSGGAEARRFNRLLIDAGLIKGL